MNIYEAKFSQEKRFYGYAYLRSKKSIFGIIGSPYYIGKGTEERAYDKDHTIKPPKNKNDIQLTNLMNEADAFQVEIFKIYLNGRIDLGTGCLRNRTNGGEGASGRILLEESRKKISNKLKENYIVNCISKGLITVEEIEQTKKENRRMRNRVRRVNKMKDDSYKEKTRQNDRNRYQRRIKNASYRKDINSKIREKRQNNLGFKEKDKSIKKKWELAHPEYKQRKIKLQRSRRQKNKILVTIDS